MLTGREQLHGGCIGGAQGDRNGSRRGAGKQSGTHQKGLGEDAAPMQGSGQLFPDDSRDVIKRPERNRLRRQIHSGEVGRSEDGTHWKILGGRNHPGERVFWRNNGFDGHCCGEAKQYRSEKTAMAKSESSGTEGKAGTSRGAPAVGHSTTLRRPRSYRERLSWDVDKSNRAGCVEDG